MWLMKGVLDAGMFSFIEFVGVMNSVGIQMREQEAEWMI